MSTVCCLLFLAAPVSSETMGWAATYGGAKNDRAHSIHEASDRGYVVAGATDSFGAGGYDAWVLKLRADGTVEWQKTYGGAKADSAYCIQQTNDGGYVVAGWTESIGAGESDAWVLKLRVDGTVEWQKTYGGAKGDGAHCIQLTSDGGYIVVGGTASFSNDRWGEAWVLKLRVDGTVEWQKTYGGFMPADIGHIQQTKDGGYITAGTSNFFAATSSDFWVLKLRADGTIEWQKAYGGYKPEGASSVCQTSEGGYIVTGMTASFGVKAYDIWVLKLRPDSTVEWHKTYGGDYWDEASSIQPTADGGYVVAGWTSHGLALMASECLPDRRIKFLVLKLRADGTVEWQKTYKRGDLDRFRSVQQTKDGGYIVAGITDSLGKDSDFLVLKLRHDGSIDPSCQFVKETNLFEKDSSAMFMHTIVMNTTVSPVNSDANPQDSSAIVQDTNALVDLFCPPTVKP